MMHLTDSLPKLLFEVLAKEYFYMFGKSMELREDRNNLIRNVIGICVQNTNNFFFPAPGTLKRIEGIKFW